MTAKAGAPIRAKKKPWIAPITAPLTMATTIASHSFMPWVTLSTATRAPETPLTEPTERSISPSSRTKMMPTAIMPVATIVVAMSLMFFAERNSEFMLWKTMAMIARPTTTGMEPRSPPLILRLNSVM